MLKAIFRPVYRPLMHAYEAQRESRAFLLRRMPKGTVCAEIGIFRGHFSQQIIDKTRPRKLHLIDPWAYQVGPDYAESWYGGDLGRDQDFMDSIHEEVRQRLHRQIISGIVQIHRKPSFDAANDFSANYFDWIYVDGDHRYESVLKDLHAYCSKVKAGGYIAGDDYGNSGWWDNGVKKAVDEFVAARRYEIVLIRNHQFVLRKC